MRVVRRAIAKEDVPPEVEPGTIECVPGVDLRD
jgi:hypothetical protein